MKLMIMCLMATMVSSCMMQRYSYIDMTKYKIYFYRTEINLYDPHRIFSFKSKDVLKQEPSFPFNGFYVYANSGSKVLLSNQDNGKTYLYDINNRSNIYLPKLDRMRLDVLYDTHVAMCGNFIAFVFQGKVLVYDLRDDSLAELSIPTLTVPRNNSISIDLSGNKIYYPRGNMLFCYDRNQGVEYNLHLSGSRPTVSPDGLNLVYIEANSIYKYNITTKENIRLYKGNVYPYIGWSYDSSLLYALVYVRRHDKTPFYEIMSENRPHCYYLFEVNSVKPIYFTRVNDQTYKMFITPKG